MGEFAGRESIILPKLHGPGRTIQIQYRLPTTPDYMYMGRPVVIWIDHDPQRIEPHHCRHDSNYTRIPKRLG